MAQDMELKAIDPVSYGKIMAILGIIIGFIQGAMLAAFAAAFSFIPGLGGFGVASIIVLPIVYAIMFFIGAIIGAVIYNLIAGAVGGIKLTFE